MNKHLKRHIAAITAAATLLALLATGASARNFSTDMDVRLSSVQHRMPAVGRASVSVEGAAGPVWCATRGQTDMRGSGWPQDRVSS